MIHNVWLNQILPIKGRQLVSSSSSPTFIQSMTGSSVTSRRSKVQKKIGENLTKALYSASFINSLYPLPSLWKIRHKSILYTTKKENASRDGSVFFYQSTLFFGSIVQFCFSAKDLVVLVEVFDQVGKGILDNIHSPTNPRLSHSTCNGITDYIFCVKKLSCSKHTRVHAISVSSIFAKCVHIPVKDTAFDYIITMPNMFEHH